MGKDKKLDVNQYSSDESADEDDDYERGGVAQKEDFEAKIKREKAAEAKANALEGRRLPKLGARKGLSGLEGLRASGSSGEDSPRDALVSSRGSVSGEFTVLHSPRDLKYRLLSRSNSSLGGIDEEIEAKLAINSKIGRGAFGVVTLAQELSESDEDEAVVSRPGSPFVAVKKIKESKDVKWDDIRAEANRENDFHQYCRDQNIQGLVLMKDRVIDYSQSGQFTVYQLMPFIAGDNGKELIKDLRHLDIEKHLLIAKHVAFQLIKIFSDMDSKRVFHRDFKPDNFLLDLEGNCQVCDFGSGVVFDEEGNKTIDVGGLTALPYFPPEFWKLQETEFDFDTVKKAEAWRLGLTILQFVSDDAEKLVSAKVINKLQVRKLQKFVDTAELERVIKEVIDKIPDQDLREVIGGLLMFDADKRLTIPAAHERLSNIFLDVDMIKQHWKDVYQVKHNNRVVTFKNELSKELGRQLAICMEEVNDIRQASKMSRNWLDSNRIGRLLDYVSDLDRTRLTLQLSRKPTYKEMEVLMKALQSHPVHNEIQNERLTKLFEVLPKLVLRHAHRPK
jgi:serine/threonine protein kinase